MAVDANALVTHADAEAHLGITTTGTATTVLDDIIDACSLAIEGYVGYRIKERTYTAKLYDGSGTSELALDDWPVTLLTTVRLLQGVTAAGATWLAKDITNLVADDRRRGVIVWRDGVFPRGRLNVEMTYKAGYAVIPDDVRMACLLAIQDYRKAQDAKTVGVQSRTFEGQTVVYTSDMLPKRSKQLLSQFVSRRAA